MVEALDGRLERLRLRRPFPVAGLFVALLLVWMLSSRTRFTGLRAVEVSRCQENNTLVGKANGYRHARRAGGRAWTVDTKKEDY